MNKKTYIYVAVVACMAAAWFGWGWLHREGAANAIAAGQLRPSFTAGVNADLPDDANQVRAARPVESVPAVEALPALGKEAESELLAEISVEAHMLLDLQDVLGEDLAAFCRLQEEIRTTDRPEPIIAFVDLVASVGEHYAPWWHGSYTLASENRDKAKGLHTLATTALDTFEQSLLWKQGDALTSLLRARLAMLKYSLELHGGQGVPRYNRDEARKEYDRLQGIEPDDPVTAYVKTLLLYQGQMPFLASSTDVKRLYEVVRQCPDTRHVHKRILMHQMRTWAFFEEAQTLPWAREDLAKDKALRYQYAIDSYENVDVLSKRFMSAYNRKYLEQIVDRATENLIRARQEAEAQGVDVDWHLRQRRRWEYPWNARH